jgi:hypothetical protein
MAVAGPALLAGVGVAIMLVALLGPGPTARPAAPAGPSHHHEVPRGTATVAQREAARSFVAQAETLADRFADITAARDAGYLGDEVATMLALVAGTPNEAEFRRTIAGGVVTHLFNPELANDGVAADPLRPDALMYATDGERYVLAGAMYLAPIGTRGPRFGGPLTVWHDHDDPQCWDGTAPAAPPLALGDPGTATCAIGTLHDRSPEMLHVWFGRPLDEAFETSMTSEAALDLLRR